jgi:hypothetical protein
MTSLIMIASSWRCETKALKAQQLPATFRLPYRLKILLDAMILNAISYEI